MSCCWAIETVLTAVRSQRSSCLWVWKSETQSLFFAMCRWNQLMFLVVKWPRRLYWKFQTGKFDWTSLLCWKRCGGAVLWGTCLLLTAGWACALCAPLSPLGSGLQLAFEQAHERSPFFHSLSRGSHSKSEHKTCQTFLLKGEVWSGPLTKGSLGSTKHSEVFEFVSQCCRGASWSARWPFRRRSLKRSRQAGLRCQHFQSRIFSLRQQLGPPETFKLVRRSSCQLKSPFQKLSL